MKRLLSSVAIAAILGLGAVPQGWAGPGDLAAVILAAGTNPGENAVISDGPNGFQIVEFFLNGVRVSGPFESGTENVGNGSAVSGSVNASYGAVADSAVEAFVSSLGFNFGIPEPRVDPRQLQFVVDAAKKLCDDEVAEIEAEIEEFEKRIDDSERKLAQIISDVERLERISLREIIEESRESASSIQVPTNSGIRAIRLAIESELDGNNSTGQIDFPGVKGKIADRFRKNSSDRRVFERLLPIQDGNLREAKVRLAEAKLKCDELIAPAGYASTTLQTSGGITVNDALITPFGDGGSGTAGAGFINGVSGNFSVANPNAKRPWAISLNSGITGLDDDRTGADRRARILNVAIGGKIRWDSRTTFGIIGGYLRGKVTSDANASEVTGDYFSATLSGDYLLKKALTLGLSATYARGENTLEIGGGTGDFSVDVFAASASLSDTIRRGKYVIAPSLSAGISQVQREGHTDSLGVIVPGSDVTSGNVNFGTSISRTFTNIESFRSITPSVSLTGSYFFRDDFDSALTSGTIAEELGLGANLATGIDMQLNDGMGLNIGGSYGRFEDNIEVWSLTARLTKKF